MSGSSSSTASTQQQLTSTQNVQGGSGLTFAGSNNVVSVTDQGALKAARDITVAAISSQTSANADAQATARQAIYAGEVIANSGLDHATAAYQSSLTLGHDAITAVSDIAQAAATANDRVTQNAVASLSAVAQQNSASDGANAVKVAKYAAVAVAAAVGVWALARSK